MSRQIDGYLAAFRTSVTRGINRLWQFSEGRGLKVARLSPSKSGWHRLFMGLAHR